MSKHAAALAAAVLISICAGAAVFIIGGAALLNRAGVAPSNSSAKSPGASDVALVERTQLEQMQVQILQYQAREQQMQMLLGELQQRGLISIAPDGSILVNH
jgi:hypothetical protein